MLVEQAAQHHCDCSWACIASGTRRQRGFATFAGGPAGGEASPPATLPHPAGPRRGGADAAARTASASSSMRLRSRTVLIGPCLAPRGCAKRGPAARPAGRRPRARGEASTRPSRMRTACLAGRPSSKRMRSIALAGAKMAGSRSGQTPQRAALEPAASRIPLTARLAASFAPSIVARSVWVRT